MVARACNAPNLLVIVRAIPSSLDQTSAVTALKMSSSASAFVSWCLSSDSIDEPLITFCESTA